MPSPAVAVIVANLSPAATPALAQNRVIANDDPIQYMKTNSDDYVGFLSEEEEP